MILQGRQVTRFLKLFDSLMAFCVTDLKVSDLVSPEKDHLDGQDMRQVIEAVWGEEGDLSAIERYVAANPDRLNRTDLREVESWKAGLLRDFSVTREGANVYFMVGRHAFAVRGLDYEVDEDLSYVPCYATTLLVPFDGLITYGFSLVCTDEKLGDAFARVLEGLLQDCKAAGHVVRTARQFIQAAPVAREEERPLRQEALEVLGDAPQLGPGTHEGVLAGLTADERRTAISDYLDEKVSLSDDHFVRVLEGRSYACAPKKTFREFLASQSAKDIRSLMEQLDIEPSSARAGKGQLVREVMAATSFDIDEIQGAIFTAGTKAAEGFWEVFGAGGCISIPDDELTSPDMVPAPLLPYLVVFHDRGEYYAQIFQEVMDALDMRRVSVIVYYARAIDAAIDYVSLAVDFRGAVEFFDAIDEAIDVLGLHSLELEGANLLVLAVMRLRCDDGTLDFSMVEYDTSLYLISYELLDIEDMDTLDDEDRERMEFLLDDQDAYEPRPVADLLGTCRDAYEWMEGTSEYQSLASFLDAHVPDGANDYTYADNVLSEVFECARSIYDAFFDDVLDTLANGGYEPQNAEERKQVLDLLVDFYRAVPKWQLNGWSIKEVL